MTSSLDGQVALVTGAGRGIGAAIATRIAADGARVIVNYRSSEKGAAAVVQSILKAGGRAVAARADVGEPDEVTRLFDEAEAAFGPVTLLVNNAARRGDRQSVETIEVDAFAALFQANVQGPLLCVRELVRRIGTRDGRILNITSGQARAILPGTALYAGTKGALEAMTRAFAADLGPRGITVNALAPGATATDTFLSEVPEEVQEKTAISTALGRLGTPEDVARAAAFLLSQDAGWITGQVIDANGGLTR